MLVLAAAIGAATAVFALVDAVLIRSLPLRHQDRLAVLWSAGLDQPLEEISYPNFLDFRSQIRAFEEVAAHGSTPWPVVMTGVGDPVSWPFGAVSGSFFEVLGVQPRLGRTLNAGDEAPGASPVAVLSNQLWQQRFGADPSVIGRVLTLDGTPTMVVGVMPPRFEYPVGSQLWMSLKRTIDGLSAPAKENLRNIGFLCMVGRRAPGFTTQRATEESTAVIRGLYERTGRVALAGLVLGVPASLAASRAMRSMLFEVAVLDATSLIVAMGILAVALVGACVVPSRRAALVDPTVTLRMQL